MGRDLVAELKQTEDELAEAVAMHAGLEGGFLKATVAARIEVLRTTRAVVRQRIMAEESGAPLTIQIPATTPDPASAEALAREIESQQHVLEAARAEAAKFAGGLVHALKLSTVATQEQSLSMLRQRYLVAQYGLHVPAGKVAIRSQNESTQSPVPPTPRAPSAAEGILKLRLLRKQFVDRKHEQYVFFDTEFSALGLKRPARAIKGAFKIRDLFGETKLTLGWTVDRALKPHEVFVDTGQGFKFNQFMEPHKWVNSTAVENLSVAFEVSSILYQDGSREDF